jgi:hypothetical protein
LKSKASKNITGYLIQVNPYCLSTAFEVWYDLAPHLGHGTVYNSDPYELLGCITDYFNRLESLERYRHKELADKIVHTFGLENR